LAVNARHKFENMYFTIRKILQIVTNLKNFTTKTLSGGNSQVVSWRVARKSKRVATGEKRATFASARLSELFSRCQAPRFGSKCAP
jgi:hypothetical protein